MTHETLNNLSFLLYGLTLGYFLYPVSVIIKKIIKNARAASKADMVDEYQNPQNWGR